MTMIKEHISKNVFLACTTIESAMHGVQYFRLHHRNILEATYNDGSKEEAKIPESDALHLLHYAQWCENLLPHIKSMNPPNGFHLIGLIQSKREAATCK